MTRQHQGYGSYKSYKVKKEDSLLVCSDRRASELVHLKLQAHNSPLTAARTLLVLGWYSTRLPPQPDTPTDGKNVCSCLLDPV